MNQFNQFMLKAASHYSPRRNANSSRLILRSTFLSGTQVRRLTRTGGEVEDGFDAGIGEAVVVFLRRFSRHGEDSDLGSRFAHDVVQLVGRARRAISCAEIPLDLQLLPRYSMVVETFLTVESPVSSISMSPPSWTK